MEDAINYQILYNLTPFFLDYMLKKKKKKKSILVNILVLVFILEQAKMVY